MVNETAALCGAATQGCYACAAEGGAGRGDHHKGRPRRAAQGAVGGSPCHTPPGAGDRAPVWNTAALCGCALPGPSGAPCGRPPDRVLSGLATRRLGLRLRPPWRTEPPASFRPAAPPRAAPGASGFPPLAPRSSGRGLRPCARAPRPAPAGRGRSREAPGRTDNRRPRCSNPRGSAKDARKPPGYDAPR